MVDEPITLKNGGEIHFKDDEKDAHVADRIEILPGGWVRAIFKNQYQQSLYNPDDISGIHTHTNALEDEDWW